MKTQEIEEKKLRNIEVNTTIVVNKKLKTQ